MNKICTKCGRELPATSEYFFKQKLGRYGLESQCKECVKKRRRKRYMNVIYEIYCKKTDKYYIGQTIKPITERISKHFSDAKRGREQPLYEDMRKFGKEEFKYRILEKVENENMLDDKERFYIEEYLKEGKKLYNREFGGRKDITVSDETKKLMSSITDFLVFDVDGYCLGEFINCSQATQELGYFDFKKYIDNIQLNNKNYIIISKEKFSYDLLRNEIKAYRYLEDTKDTSKSVYIVKNGEIVNYFESIKYANEEYNRLLSTYARGVSNHYCRQEDIYVYYEYLLP